jgi:hypothetical protein
MLRIAILLLLAITGAAAPLTGQRSDPPPPPPDEETQGTQDLPPRVCPSDFTDGPLYGGNGLDYYGIPARKIVEGWLSPPHDSFGRIQSGTQNVEVSSLRVLVDGTDYDTCLRLTTILTGGAQSAPAPRTWVYLTAGGFYFVSQWKRAQTLDDYTTSYAHVMVFDNAFTLRGAYAF